MRYAVVVGPSVASGYVPGSGRDEEAAAIARILELTPAPERAVVRRALHDPYSTPTHAEDPEISRPLGIVVSIREAERRASMAARPLNQFPSEAELARRVSVVILLVERPRNTNDIATVIRRPGDRGVPMLPLPEATTTPELLAEGVRVAIRSHDRVSGDPGAPQTITIRRTGTPRGRPRSVNPDWVSALNAARSMPQQDVPGIGVARRARGSRHRAARLTRRAATRREAERRRR